MNIAIKIIFVVVFSLAAMLLGLILASLFINTVNARTLDSAFSTLNYGLYSLVAGLLISIFLSILIQVKKLKRVLIFTVIVFILEIVFLVFAGMNNWWR